MTDTMFSRGRVAEKALPKDEKRTLSGVEKKANSTIDKNKAVTSDEKGSHSGNTEKKTSATAEMKVVYKNEKRTPPAIDKDKKAPGIADKGLALPSDDKKQSFNDKEKETSTNDKQLTLSNDEKNKTQPNDEKKKPLSSEERRKAFSSAEKKSRSLDEKPRLITIASLCSTPDSEGDVEKTSSKDGTPDTMLDRFRRRQERDRYFTQTIDLSNMSTTVAGNKLAQEIHDEFLTCKICLEGFKSPKSLDCLHTFCEGCIESHVMSECSYKKYSDYREFTCPLCRKRTQLPLGGVKKLPDNFLVSSLGELVARQRPSKFPFCDICKLVNRKHREATSKCLDCNKLLCKACVDLHKETKVTKDHSLFDCEIEKDIECKEHQDEVVRFYCEPCETCICVLCTFNEHKDHEITQFSEAVSKYKEDIQKLLSSCKTNIDVYDTQLTLLTKCDTIIKAAEQRIHDVAIQFIADIRSREKQLIDDLHATYGTELMEYVNRKVEMQNNLDSLKSTCNLTELVLKGKDIELLLLKKQVQDKLSLLSDVTLKDLPRTVHKQVAFSPGSMELGTLHDMDSPPHRLQSQLSLPASMTNAANGLHIRTTETQTDMATQPIARTVSRYIQTLPQPREDGQQGDNSANTGGEGDLGYGRAHKHTVATGTDRVFTEEKAVNTRSRSLMSQTNSLQSTASADETVEEHSSGLDPASSPSIARRQRRRRERLRPPVEVSVRPTTYSPASCTPTTLVSAPEGYGPVLTYSSSIEENHYSTERSAAGSFDQNQTPSPPT